MHPFAISDWTQLGNKEQSLESRAATFGGGFEYKNLPKKSSCLYEIKEFWVSVGLRVPEGHSFFRAISIEILLPTDTGSLIVSGKKGRHLQGCVSVSRVVCLLEPWRREVLLREVMNLFAEPFSVLLRSIECTWRYCRRKFG
jgi:hypothetical protein